MFKQVAYISEEQSKRLKDLREYLKKLQTTCIAYSGGVDSTLIAAIAYEQLGKNAIAITGVSNSLAKRLLIEARNQTEWIGIKHLEIKTSEIDNSSYSNNASDRCFYCKKELHKHTKFISQQLNFKNVIDGVNFDDLSDFRPGIKAAKEAKVLSPLAMLKFSKTDIREISRALGFPWGNKPAQPCLASRFSYGNQISDKKLIMIEKAEEYIKDLGITEVRVRYDDKNARIEIPSDQIQNFITTYKREELINYFNKLGFKFISLDLEGLISGKLNR